ncbi:MAG: ABC transporter permease [Carbonactinosporaceae bacterium]
MSVTAPEPPLTRLRWALSDGIVVTKRNLVQLPRIPEYLVFALIQPVMFVLLFSYVFGGAIPVPGGSYREYVMAGIFAQTVAFGGASTAIGLAADLHKGIVDRFRSLPMARSAVLVGRTFGDLVRNAITLLVMMIVGLFVGWQMDDGALQALAAVGVLLLFSYAMSWVGALIGLVVPNEETANTAGLIWLFPVTFVSNAFVPTGGMPGWLQTIADWNPISATVAAARDLFGNPDPSTLATDAWPMQHPVVASLLWSLVLLVVFVPLAVRRYRNASAR